MEEDLSLYGETRDEINDRATMTNNKPITDRERHCMVQYTRKNRLCPLIL